MPLRATSGAVTAVINPAAAVSIPGSVDSNFRCDRRSAGSSGMSDIFADRSKQLVAPKTGTGPQSAEIPVRISRAVAEVSRPETDAGRACGGRSPRPRAGTLVGGELGHACPSSGRRARGRPRARAGTARGGRSGTAAPCGGRDSACRRPARSPRATRCPAATARPCWCNGTGAAFGYGVPAAARGPRRAPRAAPRRRAARARRRRRPSPRSPVSGLDRLLDRGLRRPGRPTSPCAPSSGRPPSGRRARPRAPRGPRATIRLASLRRPSWSGTASTARAWPSVSSLRPTIASTSSGSSSSRTRFETAGFDRPTRSATSPSERPNSSKSIA